MGYEGDLAVAGGDGRHCVADVNHEGGPAHGRTIRVTRADGEVFARVVRRVARGEQAVDVVLAEPGVLKCVIGSLGMELECRLARNVTDLVGLGNAHYRD